jgi:hypothetical protein
MKKTLISLVILVVLSSCNSDKNTEEFNTLISQEYDKCLKKEDSCIVNLKDVFPFDWDKMYVFSNEHYPESNYKSISKITGVSYSGNRKYLENRSILFIKDKKIVHEVLTYYQPEGYIDTKPMYVGFVYGDKFPDFFLKNNSIFKVKKHNNLGYSLRYIPNGDNVSQ